MVGFYKIIFKYKMYEEDELTHNGFNLNEDEEDQDVDAGADVEDEELDGGFGKIDDEEDDTY